MVPASKTYEAHVAPVPRLGKSRRPISEQLHLPCFRPRRDQGSLVKMAADAPTGEPRRLSAPLLFAILILPPVFVWLLLRRGYSRDVRTGAFLYAFSFRRCSWRCCCCNRRFRLKSPAALKHERDDDDDDDESAEADRDVAVHSNIPFGCGAPVTKRARLRFPGARKRLPPTNKKGTAARLSPRDDVRAGDLGRIDIQDSQAV